MREFESKGCFESIRGVRQLIAADEEAEALAIAGAGESKHLGIGCGERSQGA